MDGAERRRTNSGIGEQARPGRRPTIWSPVRCPNRCRRRHVVLEVLDFEGNHQARTVSGQRDHERQRWSWKRSVLSSRRQHDGAQQAAQHVWHHGPEFPAAPRALAHRQCPGADQDPPGAEQQSPKGVSGPQIYWQEVDQQSESWRGEHQPRSWCQCAPHANTTSAHQAHSDPQDWQLCVVTCSRWCRPSRRTAELHGRLPSDIARRHLESEERETEHG